MIDDLVDVSNFFMITQRSGSTCIPKRVNSLNLASKSNRKLVIARKSHSICFVDPSLPRDSVNPAEIMPIGIAITAMPEIAVIPAITFPSAVTG